MSHWTNFYPRSPRGERRCGDPAPPAQTEDFYPRSPRGERLTGQLLDYYPTHFYPRSPRGERLRVSPRRADLRGNFYPRSPRGERLRLLCNFSPGYRFLSTLPARGATRRRRWNIRHPCRDFYPRSPRGERRSATTSMAASSLFLSTLPARGATLHSFGRVILKVIFLSTLPARGATEFARTMENVRSISIHAPREGSDHQ